MTHFGDNRGLMRRQQWNPKFEHKGKITDQEYLENQHLSAIKGMMKNNDEVSLGQAKETVQGYLARDLPDIYKALKKLALGDEAGQGMAENERHRVLILLELFRSVVPSMKSVDITTMGQALPQGIVQQVQLARNMTEDELKTFIKTVDAKVIDIGEKKLEEVARKMLPGGGNGKKSLSKKNDGKAKEELPKKKKK